MTKIYIADYILPSADLGPENPLPAFKSEKRDMDYDFEANNVPTGYDRIGLGWETGERVLPYKIQDGYTRDRKEKAWFSIVLENEFIRGIIVPGMGGKLVSLFDKIGNKELFVKNPVFQPGYLAVRNAWTSGGAEYNFGQLGHHYQTLEPLHAALVDTDMGQVVRIFTWDRVKMCSYHMDFYLPDNSKYLINYVRLINPNEETTPVYWWTNIAVPVYEGGRVIAPADTGYKNSKVYNIAEKWNGCDLTYAENVDYSYDIFFRIPQESRKWEVNFDKNGKGFFYASTRRLVGRKLFAWGTGSGGNHWNEYLSDANTPCYLEVQAGLAYTQMHSVPMPGKTEWDWLEMYGTIEAPAEVVHSEWTNAYTEVGKIVDNQLPESQIDEFFAKAQKNAKKPVTKIIHKGQGWGALENLRAAKTGKPSYIPSEFAFDLSDITSKEAMWLEFLETGVLPVPNVTLDPGAYMVQDEWFELLKESLKKADNWFIRYHLGVCYMERFDYQNAEAQWTKSNELTENCWATRNLAIIKYRKEDKDAYFTLLEKAHKLNPTCAQLAHEYFFALITDKKYEKLDAEIKVMDPALINFERIKMDVIANALNNNDFETVEKYLYFDYATIKEGEVSLSEYWFELEARKKAKNDGIEYTEDLKKELSKTLTPPYKLDFRMVIDEAEAYVPPTER